MTTALFKAHFIIIINRRFVADLDISLLEGLHVTVVLFSHNNLTYMLLSNSIIKLCKY